MSSTVTGFYIQLKPCPMCGTPNIDDFCEVCFKKNLDSRPNPRRMTPEERYQEIKAFRRDVRPWIAGILLERVAKLTGRKVPRRPRSLEDPIQQSHRVWAELGFPTRWLDEAGWEKLARSARSAYGEML